MNRKVPLGTTGDAPYNMTDFRSISKPVERTILGAILLLFAIVSAVGITWGLPSRKIDRHLFGGDAPWHGEKIYRLAGASEKLSDDSIAHRGADVDVDALDRFTDEPILLTTTVEDQARIYLRYRLYTYQPDEMITMMALAGMNPRGLDLDPRLYQYGGLFIYPVGGAIGACGILGLIDVRADVVYYLDNPDEFGKFYVVARAYSALWGLIGVLIVFAIARRLGGSRAGLLAALLFTLMPVVVCMAHEGKPHLPGAVLMLLAVLLAMRSLHQAAGFSPRGLSDLSAQQTAPAKEALRDFRLMCVCCGAALGMVLSSWPIFVLIPLIVLLDWRCTGGMGERSSPVEHAGHARPNRLGRSGGPIWRVVEGVALAIGVYLVSNPYILINAFVNRDVLRSNFGNSLAMYNVARIGEGFARVLELTVEGATLPVLVLGLVALIVAALRRRNADKPGTSIAHGVAILPLAVPAAVFFCQFVLIGAGKPAEYGRFGIFTNTALAIGTACLLTRRWTKLREVVNWVPAAFVVSWVALFGALYLGNFRTDSTARNSRMKLAESLTHPDGASVTGLVAVLADPAPYCCPPLDFSKIRVALVDSRDQLCQFRDSQPTLIHPTDRKPPSTDEPRQRASQPGMHGLRLPRATPISWANKPFVRYSPDGVSPDPCDNLENAP